MEKVKIDMFSKLKRSLKLYQKICQTCHFKKIFNSIIKRSTIFDFVTNELDYETQKINDIQNCSLNQFKKLPEIFMEDFKPRNRKERRHGRVI